MRYLHRLRLQDRSTIPPAFTWLMHEVRTIWEKNCHGCFERTPCARGFRETVIREVYVYNSATGHWNANTLVPAGRKTSGAVVMDGKDSVSVRRPANYNVVWRAGRLRRTNPHASEPATAATGGLASVAFGGFELAFRGFWWLSVAFRGFGFRCQSPIG